MLWVRCRPFEADDHCHMSSFQSHNCFGFPELARVEEEAPPAAPLAPEPQPLVSNQPSRAEEKERPVEPPPEPRPEPSKAPLHVPLSASMLDSLPMTHIATTLTGVYVFNLMQPLPSGSVECLLLIQLYSANVHEVNNAHENKTSVHLDPCNLHICC